jgi:hypothetical protein
MICVACEGESIGDLLGTFGTFGNVLERGWNIPFPLVCFAK